ncbi:MAG: serine/threonine-protein kinase [Kofleriaceae bacterium]
MDPQQGLPQQDLIVGQTIGNYLVTQKLGEGGMGSVYLAEHPGIGKKVALKVLHSEFSSNEDVASRFFNEAKAVNNIGHPNIVDIVDYGIIQAGPGREQLVYFIMEYLSGLTLSGLLHKESPLPPERALQIALQVADALSASHKCGIVHRDLKPDNIMLQQRGRERDFVKLLDFGIAKLTSGASGSRRTRTGIVMGTPAYMSPEQCDGRGNIDHRTDIYALGIVIYEMLVGRVPFLGEGYGEILVQHLTQAPAAPSQFRMVNPHVEAVVMKALEKRVEMRYPNMEEMMRAMSDPVGYIEAHGGIPSFLAQQLSPSNAPLTTSVRISHPTGQLQPQYPTPPPGSIQHTPTPMGYSQPTPPPMTMPTPAPGQYAVAAMPTTLGGAAMSNAVGAIPGIQNKKSKTGLIIAAAVVTVATVIGVVIATQSSKRTAAVPADAAIVVVEPAIDAPPPPKKDPEPVKDPGSAAAKDPGSGGSAATVIPEVPKIATITLTTTPPGAKIFINGVELDQITPQAFELPISTKEVKVVLKLDGYKDIVLEKIVPNENINLERVFKKKSTVVFVPTGRGSGSAGTGKGSAGKGSGAGKDPGRGSNDTGLIKPGD